jgi:hypothetical protein
MPLLVEDLRDVVSMPARFAARMDLGAGLPGAVASAMRA